jgi:hypothetical protein
MDFIKASSKNLDNQSSTAPLVSIAGDDEIFQITLSDALMENAQILQPWNTIAADQWIQAGKWWLLKVYSESSMNLTRVYRLYIEQSQTELYAISEPGHVIPFQAFTNLIKASWILIDVIACHPQQPFFDRSTQSKVLLLSAVSHSLKNYRPDSIKIANLRPKGAEKRVQKD